MVDLSYIFIFSRTLLSVVLEFFLIIPHLLRRFPKECKVLWGWFKRAYIRVTLLPALSIKLWR